MLDMTYFNKVNNQRVLYNIHAHVIFYQKLDIKSFDLKRPVQYSVEPIDGDQATITIVTKHLSRIFIDGELHECILQRTVSKFM